MTEPYGTPLLGLYGLVVIFADVMASSRESLAPGLIGASRTLGCFVVTQRQRERFTVFDQTNVPDVDTGWHAL